MRMNLAFAPTTLVTGWSPIVLVTTPPQPASKARRMLLSDSVGGAEDRRKGFSKLSPVKLTARLVGIWRSRVSDAERRVRVYSEANPRDGIVTLNAVKGTISSMAPFASLRVTRAPCQSRPHLQIDPMSPEEPTVVSGGAPTPRRRPQGAPPTPTASAPTASPASSARAAWEPSTKPSSWSPSAAPSRSR